MPCSNCKDNILNKTPTLIGTPLCNSDCPEEYVCLDITPAGCVSIQGKEDCLTNGETVQEQIDIIREYICDLPTSISCDCEPNTYTINSVCVQEGGNAITVTVTPNFTYDYPLMIFNTVNYPQMGILNGQFVGVTYTSIQSTQINNALDIQFTIFDTITGSPGDVFVFQISDNKGNYSAPFSILFENILTCQ